MSKYIRIGLFGFGTVGRGLFELLRDVPNPNVSIERICVRNIHRDRGVDAKFTDSAEDIFGDPNINFIVELIDDAEASFEIVCRAIKAKLPVVTGNKKLLAHKLPELIELQKEYDTTLLYDASACGSIPVIRNLEEYYDNDLLISVKGILNGSSNFILSKIFNEGMSHSDALELARKEGFLESNPTLDLDGWDSLFKLVIIGVHAFGVYVMLCSVLIRPMPSAPAASQAFAIAAISVTFGLNFIYTGFVVTAFTARVTSAADSGLVPKLIPPPCTFGQEIFTSSQPTCSSLSSNAQV